MKKRKKSIALLMTTALLTGTISPGISQMKEVHAADLPTPILDFDFEGLTADSEIQTSTASATGDYDLAESNTGGAALSLDGKGQFLSVTDANGDSLLTGKKTLTISYDAKLSKGQANWLMYASNSTAAPTFLQERYIGILHGPTEDRNRMMAERYYNNGARPQSAIADVPDIYSTWVHIDTVYNETDTIIYVNGEEKGRQASEYDISRILGDSSILQIGKANWGGGEYCKGMIDNFRIYDEALSQEQITAQHQDYVLQCDQAKLKLPEVTDRSLILPTAGASGMSEIVWKSKDESIIKADGTIIRGEKDQTATLVATLKNGSQTVVKEFTITVKAKNPDQDVESYTEELTLNAGFVSENLTLPSKVADADVTWETSDASVISADGVVTRGSENKEVILTAVIKVDGASKDGKKEFPLTVISKGADVAAYVSSNAPTDIEAEGYGLQGGMKLAVQGTDGYEVLHKDQPILYSSVGTKKYASPQIFRKADGVSFGMIAADGGGNGNIVIYDSSDLITYENERLKALPEVGSIQKLYCVYDSADDVYKMFVQSGGSVVLVTTSDFEHFENKGTVSYQIADLEQQPSDAVWAEKEALTEAEYKKVEEKFKNPYNTKLSVTKKDVTLQKGDQINQEILQEKAQGKATAQYSDGTEKTYSIRWDANDIERIDTSRPGTYIVTGTIGGSANYTEASDPLIAQRADPYIVYNEDDGYYYFTASYPMNGSGDADGYDRLILRRAKTISGLADAKEVTIWDEKDDAKRGRFIWAPELHKIGDSWYFLSTAGRNTGTGTTFDIRPFMVKCNNSADMMNPESWGEAVDVKPIAGDSCLSKMSLDMTYFEAGGRHYLSWADFTKSDKSEIYIATIDPANPTQLTSKSVVITTPEYSWEEVRFRVNEGSAVIKHQGKVYLAFSASGTGSEYCIGILSADENADLTQKSSWTKNAYPVLTSTDFGNEVSGPGHNSFTVDEYGNPVIVYHARPTKTHATAGGVHNGDPLYDPCRHCYVKPVFFDADGMPILNLSEREFSKEDTQVTIQVTVEGESASDTPTLVYDFDEAYEAGTVKDSANENHGTLTEEGASYVWDEEYGQVLYLDGSTSIGGHNGFLTFPEGFFDGKDRMTISMDVKTVTRVGNYFTFGLGQDSRKYLFLKTEPTKTKLAITENGNSSEKVAQKQSVYPNNRGVWRNIKLVITPNSISLYQDGICIAKESNTGISVSDLGDNLKAYLGKSFYSNDTYLRGYFDNVKVYDWAMSDAEVLEVTKADAKDRKEAIQSVKNVAEQFEIPNADNIKGNITLPDEKDGVSIQWTSSNEKVIGTKPVKNEGYDETPAGVVTRQDKDTKVTLTAVFSKGKGKEDSIKKTYEVTVKAKAKEVAEEDYVGYLFVRFNGTEENINQEQTYFSLSKDGLNWENLNGNQPVLKSTLGESGLRDHFIARAPEGDKFYMIATDLSIATNKLGTDANWWGAGSNGSHSIVVWESEDLVNWSEPWLAEIAPEGAGCTWAPEFIYDEKTGEYVVYWSATTLQVDENETITQEYENHAIYYAKTRDFRTFTEPALYHEGGTNENGKVIKVIDSTMIEQDGTYYRYTKNESVGTIVIDQSDSVLSSFTQIPSNSLTTELMNKQGAVEGPIIFKMNEKTADGKEQWCLMVDRFARGQGYYPLITTDLSSGEFRLLDDSEYSFPKDSKFRHGYVMPVTAAEYSALQRKWGASDYLDTYLLEQAIQEAKEIAAEQYTEESYLALQQAIEVAQAALATVTTTEEADAAANTLRAAIDGLQLKEEKPGDNSNGSQDSTSNSSGSDNQNGTGGDDKKPGNSTTNGQNQNTSTGNKNPSKTTTVKTGDTAPIVAVAGMMLTAGMGMAAVMAARLKKRRS